MSLAVGDELVPWASKTFVSRNGLRDDLPYVLL